MNREILKRKFQSDPIDYNIPKNSNSRNLFNQVSSTSKNEKLIIPFNTSNNCVNHHDNDNKNIQQLQKVLCSSKSAADRDEEILSWLLSNDDDKIKNVNVTKNDNKKSTSSNNNNSSSLTFIRYQELKKTPHSDKERERMTNKERKTRQKMHRYDSEDDEYLKNEKYRKKLKMDKNDKPKSSTLFHQPTNYFLPIQRGNNNVMPIIKDDEPLKIHNTETNKTINAGDSINPFLNSNNNNKPLMLDDHFNQPSQRIKETKRKLSTDDIFACDNSSDEDDHFKMKTVNDNMNFQFDMINNNCNNNVKSPWKKCQSEKTPTNAVTFQWGKQKKMKFEENQDEKKELLTKESKTYQKEFKHDDEGATDGYNNSFLNQLNFSSSEKSVPTKSMTYFKKQMKEISPVKKMCQNKWQVYLNHGNNNTNWNGNNNRSRSTYQCNCNSLKKYGNYN